MLVARSIEGRAGGIQARGRPSRRYQRFLAREDTWHQEGEASSILNRVVGSRPLQNHAEAPSRHGFMD